MKTKLLLIRHGETEWNKLGKFQGCTDINLSDEGKRQAEFLRERLQDKFDVIYCSPLNRAYETAKILNSYCNKEIIVANDIREINFGMWEGLTIKEISNNYPEEFKNWRNDKKEARFVGGDNSTYNASVRAKNCIMQIVKENIGKTIVIVAHGGIIKAGILGLFNMDMTMYHKMSMGNTCINTIVFNDELSPILCGLNDTNHLQYEVQQV